MQLTAIGLVAITGIMVIFAVIRAALQVKAYTGTRRWLSILGYALTALGSMLFFGLVFSGLGGLRWLPAKVEWPVGFVRGCLTMPDGTHVIPVDGAGKKIQIYSPNWQFVRGWYVPAGGGGLFVLQLAPSNRIEVITRQPVMRYLYDQAGSLVSAQSYAPKAFADFAGSNESVEVPTPWWLWMFTSPMHSWLILALGVIIVAITRARAKNGTNKAEPVG